MYQQYLISLIIKFSVLKNHTLSVIRKINQRFSIMHKNVSNGYTVKKVIRYNCFYDCTI